MTFLIVIHIIAGVIILIDGFLTKEKWYGRGYQNHPSTGRFLVAFIPIINVPFAIWTVYCWIKGREI